MRYRNLQASDTGYAEHVCKWDHEVSRFNADTRGAAPNRSEGKVFILATMHDTTPLPQARKLLWVSCRDLATAQALRKEVLLATPAELPIGCEYMDRDTFDAVDGAGRVLVKLIQLVGMERLGSLWNLKLWIEASPLPFADTICDRVLYWANGAMPAVLPEALMQLGRELDHHVVVEVGDFGGGEMARLCRRFEAHAAAHKETIEWHEVDPSDVEAVKYFRFAVAPAFRTLCVGHGLNGLSLDYALPKSYTEVPCLASDAEGFPVKRLRYSHFGCNVVHEDIAFEPEADIAAYKRSAKRSVEALGGKLPAEHGHGTEYVAPPETRQRWQAMDPKNIFNPGVGGLEHGQGYRPGPGDPRR